MSDERGPYLTHSRAQSLEQSIAATEARVMQRIDQLDHALAALKVAQVDTLRAQVGAMMTVLRDQLGGEPPRRTGE